MAGARANVLARPPGHVTAALAMMLAAADAGSAEGQHRDRHGDPLPRGAVMRLGTLRFCQPFPWALAFSRDGKLLASGGGDGSIRLWGPDTGKEVRVLEGHRDSIYCLAISADGKWLASGSQDTELRLWEMATGKEHRRFRGHKAPIERMALSPDGKVLASSCIAGTLRLWDTDTGKEMRTLPIHPGYRVGDLAFTPDSKHLAFDNVPEQGIQLVDVATGKVVQTFKGHKDSVRGLAFTRDGVRLISGSPDHTIRVWDVASGKELRRLDTGKGDVVCLALAPDEKTLTYGTHPDGKVHILDAATYKDLVPPWTATPWCVTSIAYSPDSTKVAFGRDTIAIHETATGKRLNPPGESSSRVRRVEYAPEGRWLAVWRYDDTVELWETAAWRRTATIRGKKGYFTSIAFSPAGKDLTTLEWSLEQASLCHWGPQTGKCLRDLSQGKGGVEALSYSSDGKTLAWAQQRPRRNLVVSDPVSGKERIRIVDSDLGGSGLRLSPDGTQLASLGLRFGVTLWDTRTGQPLRRFGKWAPGARELHTFSPDGRALATPGGRLDDSAQPDIILWETATGQQRLRLYLKEEEVRDFAFSPDGRLLAAVGHTGTIILWNIDTAKEAGRFTGHRGWIASLSFAPDGKTLASGGSDSTVLIWSTSGLLPARKVLAARLNRDELDRCWDELAGTDAARAYQTITRLARCAGQTEGVLEDRLFPHSRPSAERLARLIADLDAEDFSVRDKASRELALLGRHAEAALTRALNESPSAEAQRRIHTLLGRLKGTIESMERIRRYRAIEVLERLGTEKARRLLDRLTKEPPTAEAAREARKAVERLQKARRDSP